MSSVVQVLGNLANAVRPRFSNAAPQGLKPYLPIEGQGSADLRKARGLLLSLYDSLQRLALLADFAVVETPGAPAARSAAAIGLDGSATAATLLSDEEINTAPHSFSPFGPDWSGLSSAELTIDGAYAAGQGTDTLSFNVDIGGVRGVTDLRIGVEDSSGSVVQTIDIGAGDPADQPYDIGNGLRLMLGPGLLVIGDTASIQVLENVGAAVVPTNPFDGTRNNSANLQFGTPAVVDGSFDLNNETISVSSDDTVVDVVSRINASSAGVIASFNAQAERIELAQVAAGSVPTISLQGDTSNVLEALKLSTAVVTPGTDPDHQRKMDDVAAFSAVQSGSIRINGTDVGLDVATDSLVAVLDRINGSGAGVVAALESSLQYVTIHSQSADSEFTIDGNGTGFFAGLNIDEGAYAAVAGTTGIARTRSYEIADALAVVFAELGGIFRDATFTDRGASAAAFRGPIESAIRASLDSTVAERFGLYVDDSANARLRGDYVSIAREDLTSSVQQQGDAVREFLARDDSTVGLIPDLVSATRKALDSVNQALGLAGTFVDTRA